MLKHKKSNEYLRNHLDMNTLISKIYEYNIEMLLLKQFTSLDSNNTL